MKLCVAHKRFIFTAILLVALLGLGELAAHLALRFIPAHVYYAPPTDSDIQAYQQLTQMPNFSSTMGWLPQPELITAQGYRISPGTDGMKKIASVYGDSFAYGHDVSHQEVWTNVLSRLLGRRVENYGVNFYGTGQALLRFMENSLDKPEVAILVMMSENIVRNINQNSGFIYSPQLMFRPIWYLDGDDIGLETLADIAGMDAATYRARERDLLRHEFFWPESSALAKREIRFPYLFYLPRAILLNRRITYGLLDEMGIHVGAWYEQLYDPLHPSGAYELTLRICEKFIDIALKRGVRRPIILFLPRDRDINHFRATGKWGYEKFWADARRRCPEFYTLSDDIARDFADKSDKVIKEYFHTSRLRGLGRTQREIGGHYSAKGNAYLAKVMSRIILSGQDM